MTIRLRPLASTDAPALAQYADNPRIAQWLTNQFPSPYQLSDAQAFIAKAHQHQPTRIHAITVNGDFAGCIGLHPQDDVSAHNAELGYWLAEPFWGQGIMTEAVRLAVAYGFEHLPVERIFGRVYGENGGSARVLEKVGFELEARLHRTVFKNDVYYDELIYSRWKAD